MKAPKEIYISNDHHGWYPENDGGDKIKYIRADLAELTCENIKSICRLKEDVELDVENGFVQVSEEIQFKEVLRRFLESKKEVGS